MTKQLSNADKARLDRIHDACEQADPAGCAVRDRQGTRLRLGLAAVALMKQLSSVSVRTGVFVGFEYHHYDGTKCVGIVRNTFGPDGDSTGIYKADVPGAIVPADYRQAAGYARQLASAPKPQQITIPNDDPIELERERRRTAGSPYADDFRMD